MTVQTAITIIDRISISSERSPIALFKTTKGIDCVFGHTVITHKQVKDNLNYLGLFTNYSDKKEVCKTILSAMPKSSIKKTIDSLESRSVISVYEGVLLSTAKYSL